MSTTKVLVVSEYHPNEKLGVRVGEILMRHTPDPHIKIVKYDRRQDRTNSTRNLRRFIEGFKPGLSIILHSDDNLETDALIFWRLKAGEKLEAVRNLLLTFVYCYNNSPLVFFDISNTRGRAKQTIIDLELGSEMEFKEAVRLTEALVRYLANVIKDPSS